MTGVKNIKPGPMFIGRLGHGTDLLEELTRVCTQKHIRSGRVEAIGAVRKARIGYYDQHSHQYGFVELAEPLEITALLGNVSIKDGSPMVHAHVTLADEQGKAYGGHLASGTIVFACEFIVQAFDEPLLVRGYDEQTALPLWTMAD